MKRDVEDSLVSHTISKNGLITGTYSFDGSLEVFKGHFPDQPMLPGVVQMEMIRFLMKKQKGMDFKINYIKKTKFLQPIFPDEQITVEIKSQEKNHVMKVNGKLTVKENTAGTISMDLSPLPTSAS